MKVEVQLKFYMTKWTRANKHTTNIYSAKYFGAHADKIEQRISKLMPEYIKTVFFDKVEKIQFNPSTFIVKFILVVDPDNIPLHQRVEKKLKNATVIQRIQAYIDAVMDSGPDTYLGNMPNVYEDKYVYYEPDFKFNGRVKEITGKKYANRPSPPYSAMDHKGKIKTGNDGNKWLSVQTSAGVYIWKKVKI